MLRKDFIIDSLQVEESFRIGADAILLIGEALEPSELHELYLEAREKGMDVLVEVHDETVLERILQVFQPDILGINNRDLKRSVLLFRKRKNSAACTGRLPAGQRKRHRFFG